MKWFKFYGQDYISDPKMLSLSACERSCWITLLSYSSINDNGKITFLSEDQLMIQAGVSPMNEEWDKTTGLLKKLESLGMIQNDNGMITVINWNKRQETNLTSYERVKRHREKKRNANAKITPEENRIDKNRIEEIRIDKIREDKKEPATQGVAPKETQEIINLFRGVNPSYERLFPNKTQRSAVDRLIKKFGFEKIKNTVEALPEIINKKYAPRITTPVQLEENLGKLIAFVNQEKEKSGGKTIRFSL